MPSDRSLLDHSISTLAWVGDAVFELAVRTRLAEHSPAASGDLHRRATAIVCAKGQAHLLDDILDSEAFPLTDQEQNVLKRARNFHASSMPKYADPATYQRATAFEALIGWLWLQGRRDRALAFIDTALEKGTSHGTPTPR